MTRPAGRPPASSTEMENPSMPAASAPVRAVTEARSVQRVSSSRLATISSSLSLNDLAVLRFLAAAKFATGTQIARRLWDSEDPSDPAARAARRTLLRLETNRLIGRHNHRVGGVRAGSSSIAYRLESAGRRLIGAPGKPAHTESVENLVHTLLVAELVVQLHERTAHGELEVAGTEWEPTCWRTYASSIATTAAAPRPDAGPRRATPCRPLVRRSRSGDRAPGANPCQGAALPRLLPDRRRATAPRGVPARRLDRTR